MLELSQVDLDDLVMALEDHSYDTSWWIDASMGQVWMWSSDLSDEHPESDPENREHVREIEPLPSRIAYGDMEDFIGRVPDRRAVGLLERAIAGRGAFRRFKDTLFEFPELREQWFAFHDVRMRRRAIEFLVDEGLVAEADAARALAELVEPVIGSGAAADARSVAHAVAVELRSLYGSRLVDVVLYGSHARGDASPESDVDLAVILDGVDSPWDELRRMDDVLWRQTLTSGITVSAVPIAQERWLAGDRPLTKSARAEGVAVL